MASFIDEILCLITHHGHERFSGTPDFIVAQYLGNCLDALDAAVRGMQQYEPLSAGPGRQQQGESDTATGPDTGTVARGE